MANLTLVWLAVAADETSAVEVAEQFTVFSVADAEERDRLEEAAWSDFWDNLPSRLDWAAHIPLEDWA